MPGGIERLLSGIGLRYDTPTFHDIQEGSGIKALPYCNSPLCAGRGGKATERVPDKAGNCPRCGYAIFWRKRKARMVQSNKLTGDFKK